MKNVFLLSFCFCVQNYVFLLKIVCKEKKYTKSKLKKIVRGIVNFGLTKLIKPTKNFQKHNRMTQHFHNTFIIFLYFILTCKELTAQQF